MPARRKPSTDSLPAAKKTAIGKRDESTVSEQAAFEEIVALIEQSRLQAVRAVNTTLIDLYWNVGGYISRKIQSDGWGMGTVQALSAFVQKMQPGIRGFSPQNIWRMRQFFEAYRDEPILSPLLRELPWSSNLHILSLSPAMIAEYETLLPDKALLRAKLHEFYQLCAPPDDASTSSPSQS